MAPGARLVALLAVTTLSVACSDSSSSTPAAKSVVATPVDPATAGTIDVSVKYQGPVPTPQELNMRSAPLCTGAHAGPVYDGSLVVHDGHLANAVVWIKSGLQHWTFAPPSAPVVVDQRGCLYHPHVAAVMVNQPVKFVNSDPEPHNVHGRPTVLSAWNFIISRQGASRTMTFDKPEVGIPMGCDIHPWMRAYLTVVDNPYFGVTGPEGTVTLRQVPPGEYVVAVWQEKLGMQEQSVKLQAKGTAVVSFTYGGSH
jgi:plastocyanin